MSKYPIIPPAVWFVAVTFELLYVLYNGLQVNTPIIPPTYELPSTMQSWAYILYELILPPDSPAIAPTKFPVDCILVLIVVIFT